MGLTAQALPKIERNDTHQPQILFLHGALK